MLNIGEKVQNGGTTTAGQESDVEFNNHKNESQNAVVKSGQSLTGIGTNAEIQLARALNINGCAAQSFIDSGVVNAYKLTPTTGISGLLMPDLYNQMNGYQVKFFAATTNTGNTLLDIGQVSSALLGTKKILNRDGSEIVANTIRSGLLINLTYDTSADSATGAWIIGNSLVAENLYILGLVDTSGMAVANLQDLRKQLEWNQYNLTITNLPSGWIASLAIGTPYETGNGVWRFRFNIIIENDSGSSQTGIQINVVGVDWISDIAVSVSTGSIDELVGNTVASTSITMGSSVARGKFGVSGNVPLESKPLNANFPDL